MAIVCRRPGPVSLVRLRIGLKVVHVRRPRGRRSRESMREEHTRKGRMHRSDYLWIDETGIAQSLQRRRLLCENQPLRVGALAGGETGDEIGDSGNYRAAMRKA